MDKGVPMELVEAKIVFLRGQKVMLGPDLALLYGVAPKVLMQGVKRNAERFPEDFMFQLSEEEIEVSSRSQFVTLNEGEGSNLKSQSVTSSGGRRSRPQTVILKRGHNIKYPPYAFTEQGVAMLSSVLRSERAIQVNVAVMRAFVKLRRMISSNEVLSRRLDELESKYDQRFKAVFDAIRALMAPPDPPKRPIGFG
jgi:hypothetical protein